MAADRVAVLPGGRLLNDQEYVKGSESASNQPLPSSVTVAPDVTFWVEPAFAIGTVFVVVIVTVDGSLLVVPLPTISCAT